jgi:hypothetical protein
MKQLIVLLLISGSLLVVSCKKKEEATLYKVKFSVTGTSVNQFKFNAEGLAASTSVATPFTGTKDTTVYVGAAKVLSLDTKATGAAGSSLVGKIYVNDVQVATQTDADSDMDGKTQVKFSYTMIAQ